MRPAQQIEIWIPAFGRMLIAGTIFFSVFPCALGSNDNPNYRQGSESTSAANHNDVDTQQLSEGAKVMKPLPSGASFDVYKWRHESGERWHMLGDLQKTRRLIGMKRAKLYKLLGHAEESFHAYAAYYVPFPVGGCGSSEYLEFAFANDRVTKLRVRNRINQFALTILDPREERAVIDSWADSAEASKRDATEMENLAGFYGRTSTVRLPLQPDEVLLEKAKESFRANDTDGAAKAYARLAKMFPKETWIWEVLGGLYQKLDDQQSAFDAFTREMDLVGGTKARFFRIPVLLELSRYSDAIDDCNLELANFKQKNEIKGKPVEPSIFERLHWYRATAYAHLGCNDAALQDVNESISYNRRRSADSPVPAYLYELRAKLYKALGRNNKAKEDDKEAELSKQADEKWMDLLKRGDSKSQ